MKASTLGVLLNLGESFTSLSAQADLMLASNIRSYSRAFKQVYIFTYRREKINLPTNCHLIAPPLHIHRYIYALLLPIIYRHIIRQCDLLRCFQLASVVPALIAKLLYGTKFIFNYGYDYQQFARVEGKPVQAFLFSLLKPLAIRLADGVICKTKTKVSSKSIYLPNGVDTKLFYPITPLPNQLNILFVGRLEPQKNLLTLMGAVSRLPNRPQLTIVGDGSLKQQLIGRAIKLHANLRLLPPTRHSLLSHIYQSAAIFVLPSLIEGSPKALLEAMACGLPCLASDIPEHREIITHRLNGWLVTPTEDRLASALNTLIKSPHLRRHLGENARKHIVNHFNLYQIIDREIIFLSQQVR